MEPEPEESVSADDALVGRAFRRSLAVLLGVALIGGTVFVWMNRGQDADADRVTPLSPPRLPPQLTAAIPETPFVDVTSDAGITFVHRNGAYGEKLLPETMGGGCAFFDFDGDGDPDLLFVDSGEWPWRTGEPRDSLVLYENDGSGRFRDVSAVSGLEGSFYGMGIATGDYDNDGRVDVFVTALGTNRLYRNLGGGRFADVTASAGVAGDENAWSTSAAWVDIDNDGDLDLFVCNYVEWSREMDGEVNYRLVGVGRAYGPPLNFPGTVPYLYRNDGKGRFTDVSASSGVQVRNPATGLPMGKSLGVSPVDLDQDGWMDLVVANDTVQNFVFRNRRDGTFEEIGAVSGIAFDSFGRARGAMGIDAERFAEDSTIGISIGNFANEMTALYVARQDPLIFTDEAITQGIGAASRMFLTFGVFFFDYDLDGWLDLLTANGHIEDEIHKVQEHQRYAQPTQLYWNTRGAGRGRGFAPVPESKAGPDLFRPIVGRGAAYADMDGDGDPDVVLTQVGGAPLLLRNDQALGHDWMRFVLVGTTSNRDAIGAWIQVECRNRTLWRRVMPSRGYLSQSELPVTIGLGTGERVRRVTVHWPGGGEQVVEPVTLGRTMVVTQGEAARIQSLFKE
jgi:hypothetical protein